MIQLHAGFIKVRPQLHQAEGLRRVRWEGLGGSGRFRVAVVVFCFVAVSLSVFVLVLNECILRAETLVCGSHLDQPLVECS